MKTDFLETIKCDDGKVYNIGFHQRRYESGLSSLGITKFQDLNSLIKAPKDGLYRCRLTYSSINHDLIEISYHKYKKKKVESLKIIYDDNIEYSKKYLNREDINRLYEQKDSCDDIIIVQNSLISDTSIANIAFYDGSKWLTPASPLLKGTTRERLLQEGKIMKSDIKVEDLKSFSKIALLNAMIDFDILPNISFKN